MSTNNNNEAPQTPSTPHIGDVHEGTTGTTDITAEVMADAYNLGLTSPPLSASFSIDSPNEEDSDGEEIDENAPLEVDYGSDNSDLSTSDDQDGGHENDLPSASDLMGTTLTSSGVDQGLEGSGEHLTLAAKTNQIMSSYKDYIAEIQSDTPVDIPKKDLEDIEKGRNVLGGSGIAGMLGLGGGGFNSYGGNSRGMNELENEFSNMAPSGRSSRFGSNSIGSGDTAKTSNLHNVTLYNDFPGDYNNNNNNFISRRDSNGNDINDAASSSNFEDFYGNLGYHPKRTYWTKKLCFKNKLMKSIIGGLVMIILFIVVPIVTTNNKDKGVDELALGNVSKDSVTEEGEKWWENTPTSESSYQDMHNNNRPLNTDDGYDIIEYTIKQYNPTWFDRNTGWKGSTHLEAMTFCGTGKAHKESPEPKEGEFSGGYELCPYIAVCPLGPKSYPIKYSNMNIKEEEGPAQWIPLIDESNLWTSVHPSVDMSDSCEKHEDDGHLITARPHTRVTQHVVCCQSPNMQELANELAAEKEIMKEEKEEAEEEKEEVWAGVYLNDTQEYAPVEYTRGKGWEGQTYVEAVNFCVLSNYDVPYQLCSYDAVCPLGKKSQPLGGYKPGGMLLHSADGAMDSNSDTGAWLPISDNFNDWLQLAHGSTDNVDGPSPSCVRYTETNNNAVPSWGVNGEGNEELTRHVLCCKVIDDKDMEKWTQLKKDLEEQKGIEEMEEEAEQAAIKAQEYGKEQGELAEMEAEEAAEEHKVMIWSRVYENALVKYKPALYNRSKGWKGQTYSEAVEFCHESNPDVPYKVCSYNAVCPLGHNMQPLGGYKKGGDTGAWAPVSDVENDWVQLQHDGPSPTCVRYSTSHQDSLPDWGISGDDNEDLTRHVLCCKVLKEDEEHAVATQEVDPEYALTAQKYNPVWFSRNSGWNGKTYLQALSFCASSRNMIICPYSAICPEGESTRPYGGFKGEPDVELWAPIMDTLNGWVQIGATSDACLVHDSPHTAPEWGLTGASDNKGDVAPYLMCCELTDDAVEEGIHDPSTAISIAEDIDVQTSPAYTVTKEKFNPIAYNRTTGYKGHTYSDAFEFCKSTKHDDEDQILCPFQAVCPMGPRLPPYNGVIPQTAMWTPLFNQYNMWVDIGVANPCMFYNTLNGEYPEWGIKQKVVGQGLDDEEIIGTIMCCKAEKVLEYHMENSMEVEEEKEEANVVTQDMLSDLNPTWFHRDTDDWEGKTWPEAVEYCAKDEGLALCPYEAICPQGMKKPPSGGVFYNDEPNGSFAPISNGFNKWVSVSGDNTCMQWETIEGSPPSWGAEAGQEDLTRHVVCCNVEDGGSYHPVTTQSNVEEEKEELIDDDNNVLESQWFSRNDGWLGTTYSESVNFCAANSGMAVCHTSAICPDGNDSIPPGGPFDEGDDMWAPVSDTYNEYVKIDSTTSCILWSRMNPNPPSWGTEGGNEPMTRHIKCCKPVGDEAVLQTTTVATSPVTTTTTTTTTLKPTPLPSAKPTLPPSSKPTPQPSYKQQAQPSSESYLITQTFQQVQNRFSSKWYDRSSGWEGTSYFEALTFCASKGSYVPCPYEAICPLGPGQHVVGGMKGTTTSYAPIIDVPNGWVSVGPEETCMPYNSYNPVPPKWGITGEGSEEVTRQIMCCREPEDGFGIQLIDESYVAVDVDTISTDRSELEQSIMDHYHPVWYTRKHGYKGTSIEEAETFCENVAGKKLCPLAAYCPNGSLSGGDSSSDVLYLDRPSFPGEQWAPISGMARGDQSPGWVSIGTVGGLTTSTCDTYNSLANTSPMWNGSDNPSDHKQHILCCEDATKDDQGDSLESMMKEIYRPTWYDKLDGWNGGSWDDANSFCNFQGGRELCSYTAYCPEGNGKSVMGGHRYDFDQGEQWAPAYGVSNTWIMIGRKYGNTATTCMTFRELEGGPPPTNFGDMMTNMKKHIMCCVPNEMNA